MRSVLISGQSARAVRELGLALHSGPFRIALLVSALLHLMLFAVIHWGGTRQEEKRAVPLMRVRILRLVSEHAAAPAPPETTAPAASGR